MAKPANRSQLMDYFGAIQANTVWAWCGVNGSERTVYFSIWTDQVEKIGGVATYTLQGPDWGMETGKKSAARKDHDEKLALVFDQGYAAYGYFIDAKDTSVIPREIAHTRTSFVMQMELARSEDGWVTGTVVKRINVQ
jgi:hypothetical protein